MKKLFTAIFLSAIMVVPSFALSITIDGNQKKLDVTSSTVSVVIDGNKLQSDVPPQIVNGRTMLPARAIAENLQSDVVWDAGTKTVTITKKDTTISIQIDNTIAQVNGKDVELDVPAMIINGRTMLPMSFVAKSMGLNVEWDNTSKTASISSETVSPKAKEDMDEEPTKDTPSQGVHIEGGGVDSIHINDGEGNEGLDSIHIGGEGNDLIIRKQP